MDKRLEWQIQVPIFANTILLNQLLVIATIGLTSKSNLYMGYTIAAILALFVLAGIFLYLVFGGEYEAHYRIDNQGIYCRTEARSA